MFVVNNGTNRNFTMTEQLDLETDYGVMTPGIVVDVFEDFAVVKKKDSVTKSQLPAVHLWAIGDNLYIGHLYTMKGGSNKIYWTNSLEDCFNFAAEALSQI